MRAQLVSATLVTDYLYFNWYFRLAFNLLWKETDVEAKLACIMQYY